MSVCLSKYRATAYGIMNMDRGICRSVYHGFGWVSGPMEVNLGLGFAMLAIIVFIALAVQLYFLRPKTDNME